MDLYVRCGRAHKLASLYLISMFLQLLTLYLLSKKIKNKNKKYNKTTFLTPGSKFVDVLYYKHNITLITLFMNRLSVIAGSN